MRRTGSKIDLREAEHGTEAFVRRLLSQWRWSLRNATFAALAAGIAFRIAEAATGDPKPVSAAVTAVVALAPGIVNPRIQLAGFIVGFCTGLAIGAVARPLIDAEPDIMLVPIAFFAIVAASSFGRNPITLIQSGATALLVVGGGSTAAGLIQFKEALVGALVAGAFSQVFFAPDPLSMLERAVGQLADEADALLGSGEAGAGSRWDRVAQAAADLEQVASAVRGISRWTVRGRLGARRIAAAESRWLVPGRRLAAAACLAAIAGGGAVISELRAATLAVRGLKPPS